MTIAVLLLLLVAVWLLRSLAVSGRLENAAWLRAAKDSELLVNGAALAAHGAARLVLSALSAALYTLAGGVSLARGWLLRSPGPAKLSRGTLWLESRAARRMANLLRNGGY